MVRETQQVMKPKRQKKSVVKETEAVLVSSAEIERYNLRERLVHWTVAISFLYLLLSGLALYSPRLGTWLYPLLGGGTNIRIWHPYAGVLFALAVTIMTISWRRCLWMYPEDWEWMRYSWKYITHKEGVPEAGRFNAGQKLLFWVLAFSGLILLLSGIVLWFREKFSRELWLASILAHEIFAIVAVGAIIVHMYMGLFASPGSLRAMVEGKVTEAWAKAHHARWYKRVMGIS